MYTCLDQNTSLVLRIYSENQCKIISNNKNIQCRKEKRNKKNLWKQSARIFNVCVHNILLHSPSEMDHSCHNRQNETWDMNRLLETLLKNCWGWGYRKWSIIWVQYTKQHYYLSGVLDTALISTWLSDIHIHHHLWYLLCIVFIERKYVCYVEHNLQLTNFQVLLEFGYKQVLPNYGSTRELLSLIAAGWSLKI